MSAGQQPRGDRGRDGETTLRSGLQGIGYVVLMAAGVAIVGFVLALLVSWVY